MRLIADCSDSCVDLLWLEFLQSKMRLAVALDALPEARLTGNCSHNRLSSKCFEA